MNSSKGDDVPDPFTTFQTADFPAELLRKVFVYNSLLCLLPFMELLKVFSTVDFPWFGHFISYSGRSIPNINNTPFTFRIYFISLVRYLLQVGANVVR